MELAPLDLFAFQTSNGRRSSGLRVVLHMSGQTTQTVSSVCERWISKIFGHDNVIFSVFKHLEPTIVLFRTATVSHRRIRRTLTGAPNSDTVAVTLSLVISRLRLRTNTWSGGKRQ